MLSNVPLAKEFDIERLVRDTERYSPSDMKEMLRTAALYPLREARAAMVRDATSSHTTTHTIPPLRPLSMNDVIKAMEKVQPTQFSSAYRSALSNYAERASGGRKYDDLLAPGDRASQAMLQPYTDGSFFTHLSTSEHVEEEESLESKEQEEEEDSYSSSFEDDE
jgi:SpoVK/Ycf46/Vps4 family AAA+-type ATPase